jgi:lipopolysaccharide biosynthesis protein
LPQFHPTPENDAWWGAGFTEWTNIVQARPYWPGHYQPHVPGELGFYDLRLPEVRAAQAHLACAYGIDGFCYYHYWFHGRQVLDRPLREVVRTGRPAFPFCVLWANEPWTRAWDGGQDRILIDQEYSVEDDRAHIRYLMELFADPRYIRREGRPLLGVYRIQSLPEPRRTIDLWRDECRRAGLDAPYILKFDTRGNNDDPAKYGCDAAAEFVPHNVETQVATVMPDGSQPGNRVWRYRDVARFYRQRPSESWIRYPTVIPRWDNSPRHSDGRAIAIIEDSPEGFERWLRAAIERAQREDPQSPFVFVNAWNEWAEGAHLEPDLKFGRRYLDAVARATGRRPEVTVASELVPGPADPGQLYEDLYDRYVRLQRDHTTLLSVMEQRIATTVADHEARLRIAQDQANALAAWAHKLRGRVLSE